MSAQVHGLGTNEPTCKSAWWYHWLGNSDPDRKKCSRILLLLILCWVVPKEHAWPMLGSIPLSLVCSHLSTINRRVYNIIDRFQWWLIHALCFWLGMISWLLSYPVFHIVCVLIMILYNAKCTTIISIILIS